MNIAQIRQFLKLTESLNFTQAAKESGVTQPTLTRSIQRLEEQLGGQLLFRDGKDTRLTTLGMAVRSEFEVILRSEEKIHNIAHGNRYGNLDKLSLGIVSSVTPMQLSPFIKRAMSEIASTEVVIHPISRSTGIELVLAGTLDGCFIGEEPEDNFKLSVIELYRERLMLAFGPAHRFNDLERIPQEELAQELYVDRLNCEFRERVIAILSEHSAVPLPRLRSEREDWLQEVVASNCGVCMLPEFSVISPKLRLRPVDGINLERTIRFVSVSGSGNSMALQEFRRLLQRHHWDSGA